MSEALPLPSGARLEHYERHAQELFIASRSQDPAATVQCAARLLHSLAQAMQLDPAQPDVQELIEGGSRWLVRSWIHILDSKTDGSPSLLPDAHLLLARTHGFPDWSSFAAHLTALAQAEGSPFEDAADAIIRGDLDRLRQLLAAHPTLITERSARAHRSTLLHYVSANGVEDFRQKTPANIVDIARLLLDAGAAVDATSDAYQGQSTTLELTATSYHPQHAGVQLALMSLLLERGAAIDGVRGGDSLINACLANGRRQAAEFLAARGARIDLEGAAGLGNLDLVRSFFDEQGQLTSDATPQQMLDGFAWACEYGRTEAAAFLLDHGLDHGLDVASKVRPHGGTGLHWAAYEGHAELVALLLTRGSPIDTKDDSFQGTPLDWALHGWGHMNPEIASGRRHVAAVAQLVRAGAAPDQGWLGNPKLAQRLEADPRMQAALKGQDL